MSNYWIESAVSDWVQNNIDPEDYFSEEEIAKLQEDIEHRSLSLIVLADW